MPEKNPKELDPLVTSVVDAMQPTTQGVMLPDARLREFAIELVEHPRREMLGLQIVVVAIRLFRERCLNAVAQMVVLAVAALGPEQTTQALEQSGMVQEEVRRLVDSARSQPSGLTKGLNPPSGSGVKSR